MFDPDMLGPYFEMHQVLRCEGMENTGGKVVLTLLRGFHGTESLTRTWNQLDGVFSPSLR